MLKYYYSRLDTRLLPVAESFYRLMFDEGVVHHHVSDFKSTDFGLFAENDGEVVGMAIFSSFGHSSSATLLYCYVAPAFRNLGIASKMIDLIESRLSQLGFTRLYILPASEPMRRIISSRNYRKTRRSQSFYRNLEPDPYRYTHLLGTNSPSP